MPFTGFPDLDLVVVRRNLDRPLALWYGARASDTAGRGRVTIPAIGQGLAWATFWRAVRDGTGIFWGMAGGELYLRGLAGVAAALQVKRLTVAYEAPTAWLKESRQLLRARLFLNAVSLIRRRRPIAVSTMASMAGVSCRTIFRWQHLTNWGRIRNVVLRDRINGSNPRRSRPSADGRMIRVTADGIWLADRLPNTLVVRRPPAKKRGMLRRANSILPPSDPTHRGQRQRYAIPGQPLPASPPQYLFHSQVNDEDLQLWVPGEGGSASKDG